MQEECSVAIRKVTPPLNFDTAAEYGGAMHMIPKVLSQGALLSLCIITRSLIVLRYIHIGNSLRISYTSFESSI